MRAPLSALPELFAALAHAQVALRRFEEVLEPCRGRFGGFFHEFSMISDSFSIIFNDVQLFSMFFQ